MKRSMVFLITVTIFALVVSIGEREVWEEDDHEVLIRTERGADKKPEECRYSKGAWTNCDPVTRIRQKVLTLKNANQTYCDATKVINKKCHKGACRYAKGRWGECNNLEMQKRNDTLREFSDPTCDKIRPVTKKCKTRTIRQQAKKRNNAARRKQIREEREKKLKAMDQQKNKPDTTDQQQKPVQAKQ